MPVRGRFRRFALFTSVAFVFGVIHVVPSEASTSTNGDCAFPQHFIKSSFSSEDVDG